MINVFISFQNKRRPQISHDNNSNYNYWFCAIHNEDWVEMLVSAYVAAWPLEESKQIPAKSTKTILLLPSCLFLHDMVT